ncbi:LptE family protein [Myxococcus sp. CA051A]|uniref:LptE family protein n=1 Tax=unclassified Myxococcus TaxID=2648731 RepID=UPI00157ADCC7|nr:MULTISPECIES: LPS assembly lipoprotein LptE [unclassified Myxococcus]NTX16723.1 LptE family protein [Myxococcus sp. CA056]NTX41183.1 LptE family protein [Myxococcus sp. CA033]NTX66951.1 LptE family protein [Myxococcus sp. CA051A]
MSLPFRSASRRLHLAVLLTGCSALFSGCGYRLTPRGSGLPAGVNTVCAPIFGNDTAEPALETLFTRYFRQELTRVGRLGSGGACDARVEGTVLVLWSSPTILEGFFRVSATVRLRLVRDGQQPQETVISGTEDYRPGSGDILEAESNRQAAMDRLAEVLMHDGFDRLASTW